MQINQTACLSQGQLESYLREQIDESAEIAWQSHIGACESCQNALQNLAANEAMWDALQDAANPVDTVPESTENDSLLESLRDHLNPSEDPKFIGRLGGYDVCGIIGQGSTGVVLKAFELRLHRYVAIKVLNPQLASSGPARRRFEREGRAVAAVTHENVVPIYSVDETRGLPYIVMQYIPGMSLLQRIESSGSLDTCQVVRVGLQVAKALSAAHGQGIVHRDVKPANVLLTGKADRALVTDFGLARVNDDATMTRSGTISGTPQYMSPEQARGEIVDFRTDLFSLGSLMYAACSARAPFRAETVFGIIHRVCQTEPLPIQEFNPQISPWLCDFIQKLMSKIPAERFQSANEVATILENELAHLQNPLSNPEPRRDWLTSASPISQPPQPQTAGRSGGLMYALLAVGMACVCFAAVSLPETSSKLKQWAYGASVSTLDEEKNREEDASEPSQLDGGSPLLGQSDSSFENQPSSSRNDSPAGAAVVMASPFATVSPEDEAEVVWTESKELGQALTASYTQKTQQAFNVTNEKPLSVQVQHGNIQVRQTELDYATLVVLCKVEAGSREEAERIASFHSLKIDKSDGVAARCEIDDEFTKRGGTKKFQRLIYGLAIPRGIEVKLETLSGGISIDSLEGELSVVAQNGDIQCSDIQGDIWGRVVGGEIRITKGCTGSVDLLATHGNVCVTGVEGDSRLRTSRGHIFVGANPGPVSAQSSGGDVRIASIINRVRAHAQDGNIRMSLKEKPENECKLSAEAGDIFVDMPAASDVQLQAVGTIQTDFEWADENSGDSPASDGPPVKSFKMNAGTHLVSLSSSSGTIHVAQRTIEPEIASLGGSGDHYFSLGGSGSHSARPQASERAVAKTSGEPRPGAMVPVSIENGRNIDGYTLYLPESYSKENSAGYPVILYLQGAFGVGGPISNVSNWGLARLVRDEFDLSSKRNQLLLDHFIIVSPHIQNGGYDDHPEVIKRILGDVSSQYSVDDNRIYVTGLSRGGHGSWNLVEKLPGTFAAAAPVAGSPSVKDFSKFASTSVWVAHNRFDPTTDWTQADAAAKRLEKSGVGKFTRFSRAIPDFDELLDCKYVFTQPEMRSHDAWTSLYTSQEFYEWLLKQSLENSAPSHD